MKTYEEKTQRVFQKMEEATALRKTRRKSILRIAVPVLSLCLVAVIGLGAWRAGVFEKAPVVSGPDGSGAPIPSPDGSIRREAEPEAYPVHPILHPGDEGYVDPGPEPIRELTEEDAYVDTGLSIAQWNNKTLLEGLDYALDNAPEDTVFDILARPYIDYGFVYEGRTLGEYYSDMCDERSLPEVLAQLLKEGDSLKYGTALYEGGAPNGEKWAQSLYEERVAFYGDAILRKYIVDGEFLRSLVEADLEAALSAKEATKAYKAAYAAYYQQLVDTMQVSVPADVKGDGLILHLTAEEFRSFTAEHIEAWTFSIWGSSSDEYAPADE